MYKGSLDKLRTRAFLHFVGCNYGKLYGKCAGKMRQTKNRPHKGICLYVRHCSVIGQQAAEHSRKTAAPLWLLFRLPPLFGHWRWLRRRRRNRQRLGRRRCPPLGGIRWGEGLGKPRPIRRTGRHCFGGGIVKAHGVFRFLRQPFGRKMCKPQRVFCQGGLQRGSNLLQVRKGAIRSLKLQTARFLIGWLDGNAVINVGALPRGSFDFIFCVRRCYLRRPGLFRNVPGFPQNRR